MTLFKISAVALAAALPGLALAQTATTTDAPAATTATATTSTTVPGPAGSSTTVTTSADTPVIVTMEGMTDDDAKITERLKEAGYTDIAISRDGGKLMIDATKSGAKTNLVYDMSSGALTTVDGAGYTVESSAPGMQTGDTNKMGKTDQNGSADSTPNSGGTGTSGNGGDTGNGGSTGGNSGNGGNTGNGGSTGGSGGSTNG